MSKSNKFKQILALISILILGFQGSFFIYDIPQDQDQELSPINATGYLEVWMPYSGDVYTAGDGIYIAYDYDWANMDYVNIYLYEDDAYHSTIATQTETGSYYWRIPDTLPSSSSYQIFIEDYDDSSVYDFGNYFTIEELDTTGYLDVKMPYSGSTYIAGVGIIISYDYDWTNMDYVNIYLYERDNYICTIATEQRVTGSYYWNTPYDLPHGNSYQIFIEDYDDSSVYDFGNYFTIEARFLSITNPDCSDSWNTDAGYYINYDYSNVNYVNIYLYDDSSYFDTITTSQTATESYYWTIPNTLPSGSVYQIYIEDCYDSDVNNWSELFSLENPDMLDYDNYIYYYFSTAGGDEIDWDFYGSNVGVGISVYAMDSTEFLNFESGHYYEPCILSDGNDYSDSGTFDVPYTDDWYICFNNEDPDRESTILDATVIL